MNEEWAVIEGFAGRYAVSSMGRVKSLRFAQRYVLRSGAPAWRRTREKLLALHPNNSGYLLAHLYLDGRRSARLVHRLVAEAFVPNPCGLREVNHRDGVKSNCEARNLEWVSPRGNHLHAVAAGLNRQATPVVDPATGVRYPSISQAARATRQRAKTVAATFVRGE